MATSGPTALPAFLDTDAIFRTWAQGVHDALIACGQTQTADTGQINLSTVTRPGAVNTAAGYEIFRFSDALQSTHPVFYKIEYGVGGAVDRPSLWFTVGTGSNGSGSITGLGNRRQVMPNNSKTSGTNLNTFCSGTSSRLSLVNNHDPTSTSFGILALIERFRDQNGVLVGDGIFTYFTSQNVLQFQVVYPTGVGTSFITPVHPFFISDLSKHVTSFGGNIAFSGAHVALGKWYRAIPCLAKDTDITIGTSLVITNLGADRTYMPLNIYKLAGCHWLVPWE